MKKDKADRARQFLPFDALEGYRGLIDEKERVKEPRRELSDDHNSSLGEITRGLKKGVVVRVEYYNLDGYDVIEGMISSIDFTLRYMKVIMTKIFFDDIFSIEVI
ncbi:MAG: hypothetical protein J6N93_08565 [Clostridia bacterium]|nr:hypothetical protein [Clostridia bacterium]